MTSWILQWGKRRQLLLSWSREGRWGRGGLNVTASLTVLGPSVPFAVLWRKRCTKALLTLVFAPWPLHLPSFSSSFTAPIWLLYWQAAESRMQSWWETATSPAFFFILAQIIPEALWRVSQSGQTVKVGAGRAEWSTAAVLGVKSQIKLCLLSFFCAGMTDGSTCWLLIKHVMCWEKMRQKWVMKQGCPRCQIIWNPLTNTL